MAITGDDLFWELVEPMYADLAVQRSTMMGLPCVRLHGKFFASLDPRTGALLVELPADRVGQLVTAGDGEPFAPASRVFREWVALPRPDRRRWHALLTEARDHAAGTGVVHQASANGFPGFGAAGLTFLAHWNATTPNAVRKASAASSRGHSEGSCSGSGPCTTSSRTNGTSGRRRRLGCCVLAFRTHTLRGSATAGTSPTSRRPSASAMW
ncbi:hypothetical protein [Paractinoplanes durhamensis]|uniref:TfoX N-terminal domain-containing protein n=1 Tax=Paractinoplanes durhamensis TaxID=113563 RepID=A0ABQ3ZD25_9ACTN|nr:hypothetical protein [Actinoplanes durhamensis]GIE07717.1 hypothetical protein Adu01nite_90670 [Actinoplanes durhamensis]